MIDLLRGTIARRLLINFRVDPEVARRLLPPGFEPKLAGSYAIAGICLIRLERTRPVPLPAALGASSENAAHRFGAFRVDTDGERRECVYIARRHSGSLLNVVLGGRIFPGEHHHARFVVAESKGAIDLAMRGADGLDVRVRVRPASRLARTSIFGSLDEASAYFRAGSLGYSEQSDGTTLDGLRLTTATWAVEPVAVDDITSTYFEDRSRFPTGSIEFDCGLLMREIAHEWHRVPALHVARYASP